MIATAVVTAVGSIADVPAIMPIMASAFATDYGEAWTAEQIRGALNMPGCSLLLIRQDGNVVGFALLRAILDEAELLLIAVDRQAQHQGLGQTLFAALINLARNLNAKILHVEVRMDNPAINFYTKLGFTKVGERPNYYRRKDNGPTMAVSFSYIFT